MLPVQHGVPTSSQTLPGWIRAVGLAVIVYRSGKGLARCLTVFSKQVPDGLFLQLLNAAPAA